MYGRASSIFGRASPRPLQRLEIDYLASQRLEIDYQDMAIAIRGPHREDITRVIGGNAIAFLRWDGDNLVGRRFGRQGVGTKMG
jgi:hypothetical protein